MEMLLIKSSLRFLEICCLEAGMFMQKRGYAHWLRSFLDHSYSDSTEMVKIIVHTVQSQDRVLKELFGHLR